jgi:2-keto-3-deoxy-L-rhamnonate aldolase RhmA
VFPHVETRAQAVEAIRSMRYPAQRGAKSPEPAGKRGWGPGRADSRSFSSRASQRGDD